MAGCGAFSNSPSTFEGETNEYWLRGTWRAINNVIRSDPRFEKYVSLRPSEWEEKETPAEVQVWFPDEVAEAFRKADGITITRS